MAIFVSAVGVLIVGAGITMALVPTWFIDFIAGMDPGVRFWSGVLSRATLGVVFLLAAPSCRWPKVVRVVGVLMLIAAIVLLLIGQARVDSLIAWLSEIPPHFLRVGSVFALAFGALLLYGGWRRQDPT